MRFGVHAGPFYASTSTRRRRGPGSNSGCAWILALVLVGGGAVSLHRLLARHMPGALATAVLAVPAAFIVIVVVIGIREQARARRGSKKRRR